MPITRTELKELRALATKKGRKSSGLFLAEGVRLMEEAMRHRSMPIRLFYTRSLLGSRGERLVANFGKEKVSLVEVPPRDMQTMTRTETPQGMVGVFALPERSLTELYHRKIRNVLWCENVSDPGNLGTLIRSALAFGFDMLIVSGSSADVYSPKVVRSSVGGIFGLSTARAETNEVIEFARENKLDIVATGAGSKKFDYSLNKALKKTKLILAVGGEADGLSSEVISNADVRVRIAHSTKVESLNAAIAGSILMERIFRSREER